FICAPGPLRRRCMHTNPVRAGLAVALLATLAIATGCSSSAKSSSSTTSPQTTSPMVTVPTQTSAPSANAPKTDMITIKNFAYGTPITVKAGATVTVFNDGDQTHTLSA